MREIDMSETRCYPRRLQTEAGEVEFIVVLGHNVAQVGAQLEAYGLPGAVQGLAEVGRDG
jgi:hypothetical protein